MSFLSPGFAALAFVLLTAGVMVSCKDGKQSAGSDLAEAGFQMTDEDWFRACRENNVEVLRKFLTGGFSKDARNAAGDTALHVAAAAGARDAADFLLKKGIPMDAKGAGGRTPLMSAVVANKPEMVGWLLRQGSDPQARDDEGFKSLMLAVREGSAGSVEQLAAYDREELDNALLLAALLGRADVIDSLTNYGASVYSRMEDGRTPLMIAAENGHAEAVGLLLEIGASRYTTNAEGKTAAMLAEEAGHAEIAASINREPGPEDLVIDKPEQISAEMDAVVDAAGANTAVAAATEGTAAAGGAGGSAARSPKSVPIEGAVLGRADGAAPEESSAAGKRPPPVVMRYYREADVPIEVRKVDGNTATLAIAGPKPRQVVVREGEPIPGSRLWVVKVKRRMEDSKSAGSAPMEVSVVEVGDRETGEKREWISGRASTAHDPIALVEDTSTGRRYTAKPGQRFKSADGGEFVISDVRPNQIVIEDVATGEVRTIALRGPRG